jgi:hypothetical protein
MLRFLLLIESVEHPFFVQDPRPPQPSQLPQFSQLPQPPQPSAVIPPPHSTIHSTPQAQAPVSYRFRIETQAGMQKRFTNTTNTPSRNVQKNRERANAILFTPIHQGGQHIAAQVSVLDSPTPAGRSRNISVLGTTTEFGLDEPEQYIERLNLGDSGGLPSESGLANQPRFQHHQIVGPVHGRPGRKAPPPPRKKFKQHSDVWTFFEAQISGRKSCLFCKYAEF